MNTVRMLVPALLIAASAPVFAYEVGDIIVRGGIAHVDPNSDASNVKSPFSALNGIADPVEVDAGTGVIITGTYMFHKNFGVELVAALPFEHDINADGTVESLGLQKVGETKHLPPTLLLQFYPFESNTVVQPYVGAGVNLTIFFDSDTNADFAAGVADVLNAPVVDTTLDLDNSVGLGVEVGADWMLNQNLSINTSIWYLDIETTAKIDARLADGSIVKNAAEFDVAIDPLVYAVGLTYKF